MLKKVSTHKKNISRPKRSQAINAGYMRRLDDIYKDFHLKVSEIGTKNFQIFESTIKKIDYLEIAHLLQQIKIVAH